MKPTTIWAVLICVGGFVFAGDALGHILQYGSPRERVVAASYICVGVLFSFMTAWSSIRQRHALAPGAAPWWLTTVMLSLADVLLWPAAVVRMLVLAWVCRYEFIDGFRAQWRRARGGTSGPWG